jgi:outer membrane protein TolC
MPRPDAPITLMGLDEAIRVALTNAEVVRVLTGVTASTSGRTVYDVAVTNTGIDAERARFDPRLEIQNTWNRGEQPQASFFDPFNPGLSFIDGVRNDGYSFNAGLAKTTLLGGEFNLGVNANRNRFRPGIFPLNPESPSSAELSYIQPLLRGAGIAVNRVPIVIARIDTERSYFQYKDSVQNLVQGVIDAYWALVFGRVDLWAREQQVAQAEFAYDLSEARFRNEIGNAADLAQSKVALANFRAALVTAQSNVLLQEAALRNILGLPPANGGRLVPSTPPTRQPVDLDWTTLVELAGERRPDIVELKLILDADQQQLIQANNQARPRLDAVSLYRWNGLEGETPGGGTISTSPGQFTDWTLGVNFSVPLSLRRERAQLRQVELVIARDRANLQQGVHNSIHLLAVNVRNLAQFYEQYRAFHEVREAARENLDVQMANWRFGRTQYINVLLAIVDWGNAISSEAQSISQYNSELANLELETGTILESHGIVFFEERFASIGPLGRSHPECYPFALRPTSNEDRYPQTDQPADEAFDLESPLERLPPPDELQ